MENIKEKIQLPNFEDHSIAFKSKSNKELNKTKWLFRLLNIQWLNKLSTKLGSLAIALRLPIGFIIKATIFEQFIGGENLKDCKKTVSKLAAYNIKSSLDFSVEGKKREADFKRTYKETLKIIDYAKNDNNISFASLKITGLGNIEYLISFNEGKKLNRIEKHQLYKVKHRLDRICAMASQHNFNIFIDAEESWFQDGIDELATQMMAKYNKKRANIFNTIQLYRHDRLEFLKDAHSKAKTEGYLLGLKLVRGAYMEKENKRCQDMGIPFVINLTKQDTDQDYNNAIKYCLENINDISFCAATHNIESTKLVTEIMQNIGLQNNHKHICFSQLYGMSDNLSYNLAFHNYNVSKYVPYGPIKDVIPYLIRRAKENSAIAGQMSRELFMIEKECDQRSIKN